MLVQGPSVFRSGRNLASHLYLILRGRLFWSDVGLPADKLNHLHYVASPPPTTKMGQNTRLLSMPRMRVDMMALWTESLYSKDWQL